MTKTLIKNARWVVTMNRDRTIITDGAVGIEDENILEVGKTSDLEQAHDYDEVIDASGKLVTPGLIEAHVHNTQFLAKGASADVFMKKALFERIFPYETNLTATDAYWSSFQCQIEAIKRGDHLYRGGELFPGGSGQGDCADWIEGHPRKVFCRHPCDWDRVVPKRLHRSRN
ncbi:MAG: hypothetical protein QGG48_01080, partial [Desulfatiglandales bacterium]|nr:hypothetical protein [Desulfatiglandales bacterium]